MGIIVKQTIRGTIYVYVGVLLGFLTTTFLFPRIYTTAEVGLLKIIVAYSTLIAQFGTLGINGATIRLFPYFKTEDGKHHGYLALALAIGMVGFLLSALLMHFFQPMLVEMSMEKSALFVDYIDYLIILVFFQLFFSILDIYFSALMNSVHGTFLREVLQKVLIIVVIGLYFFNVLNFHQFVLSYIAAISIQTIFLVVTLVKEGNFYLGFDRHFLDKKMLVSLGAVSLFSILNGFTVIIIQNVDLLLVNKMVGIEAAGIYGIVMFFGLVVSLPARSVTKIANVTAAEAWKNNDTKALKDIYEKSCLTLFIIGSYIFLGIWLNVDHIIQYLGSEYLSGKWVIFFLGLGCLADMSTGANSSLIGTSRYYKVQSYLLIVLVVILITLNLILIPVLGLTGAAISSAAALIVLNFLRFLFLLIKYRLQPYNMRFVYVLLISAFAFYLSSLLPLKLHYMIDLVVRSAFFSFLFLLPVYLFRISEDLNKAADQILRNMKIIR